MARDLAEVEELARRAVSLLRLRIPLTQAYLFGSYAEGTAQEDSDIDIAVFSPAVDAMTFSERADLAIGVERQIDASIELHLFGTKSLAEARPSNFFDFLLNRGKLIAS
jgi:predicted nucleotidyltransferase